MMNMMKFTVPEMSCGHCKAAIEKAVAAADPGAKLVVDLEAKTVEIESRLDEAALKAVLAEEGYTATPV